MLFVLGSPFVDGARRRSARWRSFPAMLCGYKLLVVRVRAMPAAAPASMPSPRSMEVGSGVAVALHPAPPRAHGMRRRCEDLVAQRARASVGTSPPAVDALQRQLEALQSTATVDKRRRQQCTVQ